MTRLSSALLATIVPILILTGLFVVLWKTDPNAPKNIETFSKKEIAFLHKVSEAVAAEQKKYAPFNCKLPTHELASVGLTSLWQEDDATEVTVSSFETALFVYWLKIEEEKCNLVALAGSSAETVPEGLYFANEWNLGINLATAFFDPDNDMIVQRLAIKPKDKKDTLDILRLFAQDVIDFRIALRELRNAGSKEIDQMTL